MTKKELPVVDISQLTGFGESGAGQQIGIQIKDISGQDAVILLPYEMAGDFLLRFNGAVEAAFKKRASLGQTQEVALALRTTGIEMLRDPVNNLLLRLKLSNEMNIDVSLDRDAQQKLKSVLEQAEGLLPSAPLKSN